MSLIGLKLNGRYEILDHLGEGATSTVFKGHDVLLGRTVALKVLLPHVRDTTRKRFFQEAMAAAQLNHPNIMAIYDRGEDDGRSYLVIEFVDGDSLSTFIPSSPEVVIALGTQIARALDYAHEHDIIHRDIKPANIKVTKDGRVKIMDLGLALPREAQRVTAPGMVIGTPAYISPEQAQGLALDRRTDIYSLGIVLYEMATGQLPFDADDITSLLLQHVEQPPPSPRLTIPDLPRSLETIILKTLEKKTDRRFQNARALADALQASLPGGSIQSPELIEAASRVTRNIQTDILHDPNAKRTIRVVMADDHTLLRRTLASFLESHDEFVVIAESGDGDSALAQTVAVQPAILILDLNMPGKGGLDIMPDIRAQAPNTKILVLTGRDDDHYIMRALRSGAHGYLLKSTDENKLLESIKKVLDGELVMGKGIAEKVVTGLLGNRHDKKLTEQEIDVLLYIAKGYTNDQVAIALNIPMTKLIELLAEMMNKLGVRDRNAAALRALSTGMIALEDVHSLPMPPVE